MSTEEPPSILYHYTTQKGLLGIIKNREVWATDIFYLNDTMERKYAVDLTLDMIKWRQKLCSDNPPKFFASTKEPEKKSITPSFPYRYSEDWIEHNMLDDLCYLIQRSKAFHIFVFSLSKKGNLLSQWRGYCPHGGYSIGFNTSAFGKLMEKKGLRFVKCIYERNDQEEMIKNIIGNYVNDIRSKSDELSDSETMRTKLTVEHLVSFLAIAPELKSDSFKEEKEWRIVTVPLRETNFIKFREGKSTIIPYVKISIDDSGNMPIEEVIISPISHEQLSKNAVKLLLSSNEIESCSVKVSGISYQSL